MRRIHTVCILQGGASARSPAAPVASPLPAAGVKLQCSCLRIMGGHVEHVHRPGLRVPGVDDRARRARCGPLREMR